MIDAGEIIKGCRELKGMTKKELSLRSGVDRKTIRSIENYGCNTTVNTFCNLLNAMGFEIDVTLKEERLK